MVNTSRQLIEPIIIDVEASGFDPLSYPIEVGLALSSGERYSSLILPLEDWTHWDPDAERVHHIQRQFLLSHGKPIREVTRKLNQLLRGKTVYSDGWVVDKPWLDNLFYRAMVNMEFRVSALEMILTELQMECWHTVKDDIIKEINPDRHRASSDAWIVQQTYMRSAALTVGNNELKLATHSGP